MSNKSKKYLAITLAIIVICMILSVIVSALSSAFHSFSWFGSRWFYNGSTSNNGETGVVTTGDYSQSFSNVINIEVDADVSDIYVQTSPTTSQEVLIEATNVTSRFSVKESNNKIKIKNEKVKAFIFSSSDFSKNTRVTITIPEDATIDWDIDCGVGSFKASAITCDTLSIDGGVGEVQIDSLKAYKADINNGIGEISVGHAQIDNTDIDNGIGSVNISYIDSVENYGITADQGISSIKIDGEKYEKSRHNNKNADYKIDIDSGIGSIDLSFNAE